jgi:hypothetical protein
MLKDRIVIMFYIRIMLEFYKINEKPENYVDNYKILKCKFENAKRHQFLFGFTNKLLNRINLKSTFLNESEKLYKELLNIFDESINGKIIITEII